MSEAIFSARFPLVFHPFAAEPGQFIRSLAYRGQNSMMAGTATTITNISSGRPMRQ
mgnify:CR=1 FL=1